MKVKSSYIWAALIALGVAGWMMSGRFLDGGAPDTADATMTATGQAAEGSAATVDAAPSLQTTPRISAVMVENSAVRRSVRASGVIQPKSVVTVSSETSGRVRKVPVSEGMPVSAGDTLVVLATDTLPARIKAAKKLKLLRLRQACRFLNSRPAVLTKRSVLPPLPILRLPVSASKFHKS